MSKSTNMHEPCLRTLGPRPRVGGGGGEEGTQRSGVQVGLRSEMSAGGEEGDAAGRERGEALFPAGQPSVAGGALFPAFASFPAAHTAAGGSGAAHSTMAAFASFQAPAPSAPLGANGAGGAGAGALPRSRDLMDAALCASTFGHARLSDDEGESPPASPAERADGRGGTDGRRAAEPAVFRVTLSSSDSESDGGGKKRKKKDKKKGKDRKRDRHKDRRRDGRSSRDGARARDSRAETEREREVREDREELERKLKKQKKDRDKIDEVNPHHKISLHDVWKSQKPGALSLSAPVSAASVMFFDRYGDTGNFEYGHPFKLEIPAYRIEWFWCGGNVAATRARSSREGGAADKKRTWNSAVFPALSMGSAGGGSAGRVGCGVEGGMDAWRKRGGMRASMLGIPRGADKNGAKGSWRYLRKNNIGRLLDRREKAVNLASRRARLIAAGGLAEGGGTDDRGVADASASRPAEAFIALDCRRERRGAADGGGGAETEDEEWEHGESLEDMLTRRTKEFNISTRERPGDVANWLSFVALQDEFLQLQSRRSVTAITEKKVAILIRALNSNPTSEQLLVCYLETIEDQVEPDKVQYLWEAVVSKHSSKLAIWRAFLNHKKAHFKSFQMASIRAAYLTAIKSLRQWRDKAGTARDVLEFEGSILALLEDFCEFERQAGYQERAFALVQALVEYNCFCPAALAQDEEAARKHFEIFWDGEVPRLGEAAAAGFDAWFLAYRQQQEMQQLQQMQQQQRAGGGVWGAVMMAQGGDADTEPPPPYPGVALGSDASMGQGSAAHALVFPADQEGGGGDEGDLGASVEHDDDVTPRASPRNGGEVEKGSEDEEDTGSERSWEAEEEGVTCAICEAVKAVVSCEQCACAMCGNCSNEIHKQTISKHTVLPLNLNKQAGPSEEERERAAHEERERVRKWFAGWVHEEEERMLSHRLPLKKSVDAEEYDLDPERAVPFADVQGALVRLLMPKSRADLVKLLLRFVRVPIHPHAASQHQFAIYRAFASEECCCPLLRGGNAAAPPHDHNRHHQPSQQAPAEVSRADGSAGVGAETGSKGEGGGANGVPVGHLRQGRYWEPHGQDDGDGQAARGTEHQVSGDDGEASRGLTLGWWAGEEEEEGGERVAGSGTVVSEMVGSYTTLSALRHEPCNAALLSSWCGDRGKTSEGKAAVSVSQDGDEQIRRLVRTVVARFAGDSLVAGAGLWMEAVGWNARGDGAGKDECKKQAKLLLKRQQGNLHLWAAFAAAEAARGCEVFCVCFWVFHVEFGWEESPEGCVLIASMR